MKKNGLIHNLLFISLTELIIMLGSLRLMNWLMQFAPAEDGELGEFYLYGTYLLLFLIPIFLCLLYMRFTDRKSLAVFSKGTGRDKLGAVGKGMLAGFLMNSVPALLILLTGTVHFSFRGFTWFLIPILPLVFIQCSCEEILLRGYVSTYMEENYRWDTIGFAGGVLFIFHHVANLSQHFSGVFCLNVFLIGIMLYLLMKTTGSFWICCGFHTAWNFTQQFLYGLPNSGSSSGLALFAGRDAQSNFFFDSNMGIEGSLCATVIIAAAILFLIWKGGYWKMILFPPRINKEN